MIPSQISDVVRGGANVWRSTERLNGGRRGRCPSLGPWHFASHPGQPVAIKQLRFAQREGSNWISRCAVKTVFGAGHAHAPSGRDGVRQWSCEASAKASDRVVTADGRSPAARRRSMPRPRPGRCDADAGQPYTWRRTRLETTPTVALDPQAYRVTDVPGRRRVSCPGLRWRWRRPSAGTHGEGMGLAIPTSEADRKAN